MNVFVSGIDLWCGGATGKTLGRTCVKRELRGGVTGYQWYDISDADITMNPDPASPWAWGDVGYGSYPNKLSFQGVVTHELGHVAGLNHEDDHPCTGLELPTMCPGPSITRQQIYEFRTLESVDISSVNFNY